MKKFLSLLFALLLLLPAAVAEEEAAPAPLLEVHQFALGYADGYFIRLGDIEIMVDGGKPVPFAKNDDVVNTLRALGATTLDAYIVTHWHLDHCENVNVVLEEFGSPETVTYSCSEKIPKTVDNGNNKERYLTIGELAQGEYRWMQQGDVVEIGPLTITCIGPANGGRYGKQNADSLNFVLQYGERRMLFTGDYAASGNINKVFTELCKDVDVLKFPHHGGTPFEIGSNAVRTVNPVYVLVPSDLNNYQVYTFLQENGAATLRENVLTNREGHVVIVTDGGDLLEARTHQDPADYAPKAP